jgi:hypothetical protein
VNEFASVCFCSRRGHPHDIRSYEHKIFLLRLWPRISRRLAGRAQQLELNLWTRRQAAESSPGSNSRYGVQCVNPDRSGTGDTFDAMEMQRVQVYYAFYEARFIGCGWQMPPMQKYGVWRSPFQSFTGEEEKPASGVYQRIKSLLKRPIRKRRLFAQAAREFCPRVSME